MGTQKVAPRISHIMFLLIVLVLVWGMYILNATSYHFKQQSEKEYLKDEIIKLSKKYVATLAKEKFTQPYDDVDSQRTAVLITDMLDRIQQLEGDVSRIIINNTEQFANMFKTISKLNTSIFHGFNWTDSQENQCKIPNDKDFPQCQSKVKYFKTHWKKVSGYKTSGFNGSICSILAYLSTKEKFCPRTVSPTCVIPVDPKYKHCAEKVKWMQKNWKTEDVYRRNGVDGTDCSFLRYLSEVESWCPLEHTEIKDQTCPVPESKQFPYCLDKVKWMKRFWTSDQCYAECGVNGSVCSFVAYLSEYESWCPLYPGRMKADLSVNQEFLAPDMEQTDLNQLLDLFKRTNDNLKYSWIVQRITRLWAQWVKGLDELKARLNLKSDRRKNILIYIGLLANEKSLHFARDATKGGPLGEFVQWSDIIAALFLLGHTLTISMSKTESLYSLHRVLSLTEINRKCPSKSTPAFDVIYTDYIGLGHITSYAKNTNNIKCRLRVVDSFGTEAQFNVKIGNKKNSYGYRELNLRQFNTMFPHTPDNTFLGFISESGVLPGEVVEKKERIALVYGKDIRMWKKVSFLKTISKYFTIHATVEGKASDVTLPSFVVNHGLLDSNKLQALLKQTTLFVGMGFPFEGPAPLEAIANGCFFLNVKFKQPVSRANFAFFRDKPTNRELTSQHPYAADFIGKPYVYTVDVFDESALVEALDDMETKVSEPYQPYEFTHAGMLERLFAFNKHHDFCNTHRPLWPPLKALNVVEGQQGESCSDSCKKKGFICEPAFFETINTETSFKEECASVQKVSILSAPVRTKDTCYIQENALYYSCSAKLLGSSRVCPCRDFRVGQVALSKYSLETDML